MNLIRYIAVSLILSSALLYAQAPANIAMPVSIEATVASASTIAPTAPIVRVTGTAAIATITPPTGCTITGDDCGLTLLVDAATGPFTLTTAGNIAVAASPAAGSAVSLIYSPASSNWYLSGGAAGSGGSYAVTGDSSGNFTCNFATSNTCLVTQGTTSLANPTLTNLPTNQFVHFVMATKNLSAMNWPSNVYCNIGDNFKACGNVNGYDTGWTGSGTGKYSTTFWSDGTSLWANGDTGNIQTVDAGNVNVSALQVYNIDSTAAGSFGTVLGSRWTVGTSCASAASPAVCNGTPIGSSAIPAGSTSIVVDANYVSANSQFRLTFDSSLGTFLGGTCDTNIQTPSVSARTAGTSFTISVPNAVASGKIGCVSWQIIN